MELYSPDGAHDHFTQDDTAPDYLGPMAFDRLNRFMAIHDYSVVSNLPPGVSIGVEGGLTVWARYNEPYAFLFGSSSFQPRAFTFGEATTRYSRGSN